MLLQQKFLELAVQDDLGHDEQRPEEFDQQSFSRVSRIYALQFQAMVQAQKKVAIIRKTPFLRLCIC